MNLPDRFKAALEAVVLRITGKYDYAIPYACAVVSQNSDDQTLELKPDSSLLPGLSRVPIRYGAPGITAQVGAGARCFVVFEDGNPAKPVVAAWDMASPLVMLTFAGGNQSVVRVGDLIQSGGPGTMCAITLTTPVPAPGFVIAPLTPLIGWISFSPIPPDPTGASCQPLYGVPMTGAPTVQS